MACEFICDGCGKREKGMCNWGAWIIPVGWFRHVLLDNKMSCSKKCGIKVERESKRENHDETKA